MHAPKNRSSLGTLLEPFAVGLQSWQYIVILFSVKPRPLAGEILVKLPNVTSEPY
jgi:hypothetical protein